MIDHEWNLQLSPPSIKFRASVKVRYILLERRLSYILLSLQQALHCYLSERLCAVVT